VPIPTHWMKTPVSRRPSQPAPSSPVENDHPHPKLPIATYVNGRLQLLKLIYEQNSRFPFAGSSTISARLRNRRLQPKDQHMRCRSAFRNIEMPPPSFKYQKAEAVTCDTPQL